ncbi:hypothetical protein [Nocardia salmonicida]
MSDDVDHQVQFGEWIRRIDKTSGRISPWGRVMMTIPSPHGPCWLVDLYNGGVEVWPIDDPTTQYQLLSNLKKGGHHGRPGN